MTVEQTKKGLAPRIFFIAVRRSGESSDPAASRDTIRQGSCDDLLTAATTPLQGGRSLKRFALSSEVPESTKEDAGVAETRKGAAVIVGGGRESSCVANSRNTNGCDCGGGSISSTSDGGGVGGGGGGGDSGGAGGGDIGDLVVGVGGGVGGGLSSRGGSSRLVIEGPVEGPASGSRVAARVHPSWGTDARGVVGPSASSERGGCPAADGVPGRNVAVGTTTRNHQPMGANLTKQSRVSRGSFFFFSRVVTRAWPLSLLDAYTLRV